MRVPGSNIPENAEWLDWQQIEDLSVDLSNKIQASGKVPDKLVVLPRGGLHIANIVSRRLDIPGHRILSAAVTSYETGEIEPLTEFRVGQFPTRTEAEHYNLLVVDEVCDTGGTLTETVRRLRALGAASVWSAVLHYKPGRSKTGYIPDFYVNETKHWLVYPWERHEGELRLALEAQEKDLALASLSDAA